MNWKKNELEIEEGDMALRVETQYLGMEEMEAENDPERTAKGSQRHAGRA